MSDLLGMQRAVWRSTRPTTEKIVLLAIIDHYSDSSPEPWPSVPTIAACASLGRTAVLEALSSLERDGIINVRRVAGRPNRYDLSRVQATLATTFEQQREHITEPVRLANRSEQPNAAHSADPVRDADQFEEQTSPPAGRDQSVCRTGPVRLPDPNDPKKDPTKEPTAVRAHVSRLDPAMPLVERAQQVLRDPRAAPNRSMTSSNLLKTEVFLGIATLASCESRAHDEGKAAPIASALPVTPTEPTLVEVSAHGFQPPHVTLTGTRQLRFRRTSDQTCATEVVFPALGIEKKLPMNSDVVVDLPPNAAGEVAFQCGMGMYRGSVVAQ